MLGALENKVTFKEKLVTVWELKVLGVCENLRNYQYTNLESSLR